MPIRHPANPLKTVIQFTPHMDKFLFNPGADPAGYNMLKRKGFMFKDAFQADGAVWVYLPNIELFDKESQDRYLANHTDILTRPTKTRKDFE